MRGGALRLLSARARREAALAMRGVNAPATVKHAACSPAVLAVNANWPLVCPRFSCRRAPVGSVTWVVWWWGGRACAFAGGVSGRIDGRLDETKPTVATEQPRCTTPGHALTRMSAYTGCVATSRWTTA